MKRYFAEFVGTFVLVFGGCGAAVLAGDRISNAGVALAFGLSLLAMVYTIGPISGCHVNPAVTFGLWLSGKFEAKRIPGYVVAQIIGAIVAAAVLLAIAEGRKGGYHPEFAGFAANGFGAHSPGHYDMISGLLTEIVLTAFLVLTVLGSTDAKAPVGFAGLAIGFVLTLIHLIGIPITNTSVNPARSIGPALFVGGWALSQLWLFIVAPLIGAAVAALAFRLIATSEPPLMAARAAESALPSEQLERSS